MEQPFSSAPRVYCMKDMLSAQARVIVPDQSEVHWHIAMQSVPPTEQNVGLLYVALCHPSCWIALGRSVKWFNVHAKQPEVRWRVCNMFCHRLPVFSLSHTPNPNADVDKEVREKRRFFRLGGVTHGLKTKVTYEQFGFGRDHRETACVSAHSSGVLTWRNMVMPRKIVVEHGEALRLKGFDYSVKMMWNRKSARGKDAAHVTYKQPFPWDVRHRGNACCPDFVVVDLCVTTHDGQVIKHDSLCVGCHMTHVHQSDQDGVRFGKKWYMPRELDVRMIVDEFEQAMKSYKASDPCLPRGDNDDACTTNAEASPAPQPQSRITSSASASPPPRKKQCTRKDT